MGSPNGSPPPNLKNFTYSSRQLAVSPFFYLHVASSNSDADLLGSKGNSDVECTEGEDHPHHPPPPHHHHHQRCSSENFIIEDQPSWLEELLSEPETVADHSRSHQRSASDFCAYSNKDEHKSINKHDIEEEPDVQNFKAFGKKEDNTAQAKCFPPRIDDAKRAKQQSAHRSRVKKLKYIAELEKTVQLLQAEGFKIQAEHEFCNQQNLILSMENRALRQRLDDLLQEQLIKHLEQEMLERELARLQTICQLQTHHQMQMQQQPQQHFKHHRTKSQPQFANLSLKNKDASFTRGSAANSSIRI